MKTRSIVLTIAASAVIGIVALANQRSVVIDLSKSTSIDAVGISGLEDNSASILGRQCRVNLNLPHEMQVTESAEEVLVTTRGGRVVSVRITFAKGSRRDCSAKIKDVAQRLGVPLVGLEEFESGRFSESFAYAPHRSGVQFSMEVRKTFELNPQLDWYPVCEIFP
jgi:hypothetical protein